MMQMGLIYLIDQAHQVNQAYLRSI